MTPLDQIKAEVAARLLETGSDMDGWRLYVSNRKWRMAAKELGIKGSVGQKERIFIIGKVKIVSEWTGKEFRWELEPQGGAVDAVLRNVYLPGIKDMLNNSSVLLKHFEKEPN